MSVAPCRCLSALSGPVGLAYSRKRKPAQLQGKPAQQRHRYSNAAVGERKVSYETQVDPAPTFKSLLTTPKVVNALHAVSFHCWEGCDLVAELQLFWGQSFFKGLEKQGLSEALFQTLSLQEQAELLSIGFLEAVIAAVTQQGDLFDGRPHSVQDVLSLATVVAAFQQVLLK